MAEYTFKKVEFDPSGRPWINIEGIIELTGKEAKSAHMQYYHKFIEKGNYTKRLVAHPQNARRTCWYILGSDITAWMDRTMGTSAPKQLARPKSIAEQLA